MKFIKYIKSYFKKPVRLNCGSVNIKTGETTTGFQDGFGNVKYKPSETLNLWNREYFGVADRWKERIHKLTGKVHREEYPVSIYKDTHKFTGSRMYYVDEIGYINTDAFEKDKTIIPLLRDVVT